MSKRREEEAVDYLFMPLEERLARGGVLVAELERRGEDLRDTGLGREQLAMLLDIGHGKLLPEVAAHFDGKPRVLKKVAQLTHAIQRAYLKTPKGARP